MIGMIGMIEDKLAQETVKMVNHLVSEHQKENDKLVKPLMLARLSEGENTEQWNIYWKELCGNLKKWDPIHWEKLKVGLTEKAKNWIFFVMHSYIEMLILSLRNIGFSESEMAELYKKYPARRIAHSLECILRDFGKRRFEKRLRKIAKDDDY